MSTQDTRERPIIFSGPMIRAILSGTKTQTRRVIKPQPFWWVESRAFRGEGDFFDDKGKFLHCPYDAAGSRLWVRETWGIGQYCKDGIDYWYKATEERCAPRWKPSIHMPREASRLLLDVVSVRVERVQDISEADCRAEGIEYLYEKQFKAEHGYFPPGIIDASCLYWQYKALWDSINGKREGCAWAANPWVWVIEFRRVDA